MKDKDVLAVGGGGSLLGVEIWG
jgi:hypothetical protein